MKVHYEKVIVEGKNRDRDYAREKDSSTEYCCDCMKSAKGSNYSEHPVAVKIYGNRVKIMAEEYSDRFCEEYSVPIKFCPWCGEKIEFIQDALLKEVSETIIIPAQERVISKFMEIKDGD